MPSWMLMQYKSNHFKWDNNFDKINSQTIGASIQYRALQTGVNYFTITNYVFFDNYIRPLQSPKTIKIFNAFLSKKFTLGRWVMANQIVYQKKLDSTNFIRLPELLSKNSLYFNGSFFKRALIMQIGVDLLYNTKYYADAYSPALAQFYLQNEKKIGDYPYIDLFLVARVKRASIFLKLQHASSGLMERTYYSSPNYPMQGRAIKFGVTWRFYN